MKAEPRCKICRREGKKLFLKGERCYSTKCAVVKRKYPPGAHGQKGYPRLSEYGRQMREKQALKRTYCVSEKQFKNYYIFAKRGGGNTEISFLQFLEKRLDNVIYRAGLAASRPQARQLVSHGNILVNNRRLNIPSYQVKIGDTIQPKDKKAIVSALKQLLESGSGRDKQDLLPSWLNLDKKNLQVKVIKEPVSEDLAQGFETELILGFYSR